jgi:hypothetical protein
MTSLRLFSVSFCYLTFLHFRSLFLAFVWRYDQNRALFIKFIFIVEQMTNLSRLSKIAGAIIALWFLYFGQCHASHLLHYPLVQGTLPRILA